MLISPTLRRLVPVVLVLALSACGFQLRNALVLPPDLGPVKVVSVDRYSPLAQSLAQSLTRAGAEPATSAIPDPAVLHILTEQWGDTPISVDSFGRAQEFSLRYAVVFELRRGDGTAVVPQQTIELARDYISVPTNSIGTEGERDILVRELQREMAASVLRRISAVSQRDGTAVGALAPPEGSAAATAMELADAVAPEQAGQEPVEPVPADASGDDEETDVPQP